MSESNEAKRAHKRVAVIRPIRYTRSVESLELPIRTATQDDREQIVRLLFAVFNDAFDQDEADIQHRLHEPERTLVVTAENGIVGTAAAFTRDMSVPGAVLPVAHVTGVGVLPTHRRRGLLRRLMLRQLRDVYDRREAVAALWASEGRIYQRFGYGLGTLSVRFEVQTRELTLSGPAGGRIRSIEPGTAAGTLSPVYERVRAERPGWSSRDERWWHYLIADSPGRRRGATERRVVVHQGQSDVDGYAIYRVRAGSDHTGPAGEVHVTEIVATDPVAYTALWRFLLGIDLTRTARYRYATTDEPLLHLADEPRRLDARVRDGLWVRVVDVGAALSARRYLAPVDVVIEVADALLPENNGRWKLITDASGAGHCERTDAPAQLACDISVLGAVYLGGSSLTALAGAGRVAELRPGSLAPASTALGWHRAPSAIEVF
jgi:predicted acetyltransferase